MSNSYSFQILKTDADDLLYSGTLPLIDPDNTPDSGDEYYEVSVDRALSRQTQHRVLTANFGDGYEQRVLDGINTKDDSFSVSFTNRSAEDIELIAGYFDLKAGKNFNFTVRAETLKVVCESYSISYIQDSVYSLQTTFRRVYEP